MLDYLECSQISKHINKKIFGILIKFERSDIKILIDKLG